MLLSPRAFNKRKTPNGTNEEEKWAKNIDLWQQSPDICSHISDVEKQEWINATLSLQAFASSDNGMPQSVVTTTPEAPMAAWGHALSVQTFQRRRKGRIGVEYVHVPIEPTAAFLRDPRKCWEPKTEKFTQSKDYLAPLSIRNAACAAGIGDDRLQTRRVGGGACDAADSSRLLSNRASRAFLFDAGATLPSREVGKNRWTGTAWLFEW
jgi:hypothetical protein